MPSIRALGPLWVFSPRSRWRLAGSVLVSAALALAEIAAFSAIVPLVQLMSGIAIADSSILSEVADITGSTTRAQLAAWICGAMVALFVAKGACGLLARWWILGFIYDEEARLAEELATYYSSEDLEFHLANHSAELIRNLNESVSQTFVFAVVGIVGLLGELTFVTCIGAVLLAIAPQAVGAFLVYVTIATALILRFIRPRARRHGTQIATSSAEIYSAGRDLINAHREITLSNASPLMVSKYMKAKRASTDAHRRAAFVTEAPRYLLEMVLVTGIAVFASVLFLTLEPDRAFPLLALVAVAGFRLMPTLSRMLAFASLVRIGLPAFDTIKHHLIQARTLPVSSTVDDERCPIPIHDGVELSQVRYRYRNANEDAIRDINLFMPKGSSTALVGRSGSGKSTLADVVAGLLRPHAGSVKADGTDIAAHPERWSATLGVVSQTTYVLDASIRDNVAFGIAPDLVDEDRLATAIRQAGLEEFVSELPFGLDTRLGEGGGAVSGGQRQRVGLARAFYWQPGLLILDEATSALDNVTEAQITETLTALRGHTTILVIAHRLSTVQGCDQVVFMQGGEIRETGTFAQVSQASDEFAEMVRLGAIDAGVLDP